MTHNSATRSLSMSARTARALMSDPSDSRGAKERHAVASATLMRVFGRLLAAFGPQHWWPADSPFEMMVGAILTQNTNWRNVEKAISNLKGARLLSPRALGRVRPDRLARLIRPAGYFNVKADRLKEFVRWFNCTYGGSAKRMFSHPPDRLRDELLAVKGIGPETAEARGAFLCRCG